MNETELKLSCQEKKGAKRGIRSAVERTKSDGKVI